MCHRGVHKEGQNDERKKQTYSFEFSNCARTAMIISSPFYLSVYSSLSYRVTVSLRGTVKSDCVAVEV